ncbi:hypothetical protein [Xanthobacter autotrophicus]|uniref:hypothetical protein n=1 Tax=Xanthobacter autotrophicus TaxID=280 RepID=UPI0037299B4A
MADYRDIAAVLPPDPKQESPWQGVVDALVPYLRNSYDGLARGAKASREFMDSVTPGPALFASMLPGAGLVQGGQDALSARDAFNRGQYGKAFGDAVSSVANAGLEMTGPLGHAAMAVAPALRRGTAEAARTYRAQAMPAVQPKPIPESADLMTLYHGTGAPADFQKFDPYAGGSRRHSAADEAAVFLSPDPKVANAYAYGERAAEPGAAGGRVFKLSVDPGAHEALDLPDLIRNSPEFRDALLRHYAELNPGGAASGQSAMQAYIDRTNAAAANSRLLAERGGAPELADEMAAEAQRVPYSLGAVSAAVRYARDKGLDTATLRGLAEHHGADQVVALTPNRVWNSLTGKLMYGVGGAGLAGIYGASPRQKESDGRL